MRRPFLGGVQNRFGAADDVLRRRADDDAAFDDKHGNGVAGGAGDRHGLTDSSADFQSFEWWHGI